MKDCKNMRVLALLVGGVAAFDYSAKYSIDGADVTFTKVESDNSNCPYELPTNALILDTRTSAEYYGLGTGGKLDQITGLGQGNGGQVAVTAEQQAGFCQASGGDKINGITTSDGCTGLNTWVQAGDSQTQKASFSSLDPAQNGITDTDVEFIQMSWKYGSFYNGDTDGSLEINETNDFTGDKAVNVGYLQRVRSAYFKKYGKELSKETPIFTYCRTGARSGEVARYFRQLDYPLAMNIGGWWDKNDNWFHQSVYGFAFGRLSDPLCGIPASCPYAADGKLLDISANGDAQAGLAVPYTADGTFKTKVNEAFYAKYDRNIVDGEKVYIVGDSTADVSAANAALAGDYAPVNKGKVSDLPFDRECGSGDVDAKKAENSAVFRCLYAQANCQLTEPTSDKTGASGLCTSDFDCKAARKDSKPFTVNDKEPSDKSPAAALSAVASIFAIVVLAL